MPDPRLQAWDAALGELEARLDGFAADASGVQAWRPPTHAGAIPPEYVGRATALLKEQERVAAELRAALADTARHLAALRAIPARRARDASVYLDVTG